MKNELDIIYADDEHKPFGDLIEDVVNRLPSDVRRKVCRRCVFILVGNGCYGQYHEKMNRYVILLTPRLMDLDKLSPTERKHVIAHEIAHFHRKHHAEDEREEEKEEIEADECTQRWGFPAI